MPPKFEQPEIPGRDHRSMEVPEDVARRMEHDFLNDGDSEYPTDWFEDAICPQVVVDRFRDFAESYAGSPVENLLVLDRSGGSLHRARGEVGSVPFPVSPSLRGAFAIHNHPEGTPPSVTDLEHLVQFRFGMVRVVTPSRWIFDVASGRSCHSLPDFVFALRSADETSWAIAEECIRKHGLRISDIERFARRQHAVLMEMARRSYLCYSRRKWMSAPELIGKVE